MMTFGSPGTGARPKRGHPAFSVTHTGTEKPGVPLCRGIGPKVFEERWSQMWFQQAQLGEGSFHRWLADRHSFYCDQMDTS